MSKKMKKALKLMKNEGLNNDGRKLLLKRKSMKTEIESQ